MYQQLTTHTTHQGRTLVTIETGTNRINFEFLSRKDALAFVLAYRKSTSRKCRRFVEAA